MPMPMTAISFPKYERLRYVGKVFGFFSWIFLIITLIIHGGFYFFLWGVFELFGVDITSEKFPYLVQVMLITFAAMLPYGKYSFSLMARFKKQLFRYIKDKYKTDFKVIDNKKFFRKIKQKHLALYALTRTKLRDLIIENKENKSDKKKRYTTKVFLDDVLSFPKGIKICEIDVNVDEEVLEEDEEGKSKWESGRHYLRCFSGLLIIIKKPNKKISKSKIDSDPKIYSINNDKVIVKSKYKRREKRNSYVNLFFNYWFAEQYSSIKINKSLKYLKQFEVEEYRNINKSLSEIAETLNVDYVIEDNNQVYLFHKEDRNINFFSYYQNQRTEISAEIFEEDFKLLLEISEKF